jgi:acyl carrier protein
VTKETLLVMLTELFIDYFDDDVIKLKRESTSEDIEDWDSLAQVGIILSIEKEFDLKLNSSEVRKLENVGAMVDLIFEKKS